MPFKIINPMWKSGIERKAEQCAPVVLEWLSANNSMQKVSLVELRAGLPLIAADLTRSVVNQIAAIIGTEIEGSGDQDD